jgi:hypothetical protein
MVIKAFLSRLLRIRANCRDPAKNPHPSTLEGCGTLCCQPACGSGYKAAQPACRPPAGQAGQAGKSGYATQGGKPAPLNPKGCGTQVRHPAFGLFVDFSEAGRLDVGQKEAKRIPRRSWRATSIARSRPEHSRRAAPGAEARSPRDDRRCYFFAATSPRPVISLRELICVPPRCARALLFSPGRERIAGSRAGRTCHLSGP